MTRKLNHTAPLEDLCTVQKVPPRPMKLVATRSLSTMLYEWSLLDAPHHQFSVETRRRAVNNRERHLGGTPMVLTRCLSSNTRCLSSNTRSIRDLYEANNLDPMVDKTT